MSYQLELERTGKVPKIDMPEVAHQPEPIQQTNQVDIHPDLAAEINKYAAYTQQPENEVVQEEEQSPEQEQTPVVEQPKSESRNERNIRFLREKAERADRAERERDELLKRLHAIESSKQNTQQESPEYSLNEDDMVEGKHLKKYDRTISELKAELNSYKQQSNAAATDALLKSRFPDLEKVINKDTVEILRQDYPELAETINSNPDLYSKAVTAYTLIKQLGIHVEDNFVEEKARVQKNAAKPRPLASISPQQGESPLSKANQFANGLTDELKAQLNREMFNARNKM